jgi:hypothetical protein
MRFEAMNLELDARRSGRVQQTLQPLDADVLEKWKTENGRTARKLGRC